MRGKRRLDRISISLLLGLYLVWTAATVFAAPPDYNWYIRMIRADEAWAAGWTGTLPGAGPERRPRLMPASELGVMPGTVWVAVPAAVPFR